MKIKWQCGEFSLKMLPQSIPLPPQYDGAVVMQVTKEKVVFKA